jgi:transposase
MARFVEGADRHQVTLLPNCLEDYVGDDNPVRVVDAFVDELDLGALGFAGIVPASTGRPGYHPALLLKLYLYGYLNQVQSSRRLEREAGRNVELMWLTGRLAPDFKTIADFRRHNGEAIRATCRQFVSLCRQVGLLAGGVIAIDGSRFRAVNTRDRNFTPGASDAASSRSKRASAGTSRRWIRPTGRRTTLPSCGQRASRSGYLRFGSGCASCGRWKAPSRPRRTVRSP